MRCLHRVYAVVFAHPRFRVSCVLFVYAYCVFLILDASFRYACGVYICMICFFLVCMLFVVRAFCVHCIHVHVGFLHDLSPFLRQKLLVLDLDYTLFDMKSSAEKIDGCVCMSSRFFFLIFFLQFHFVCFLLLLLVPIFCSCIFPSLVSFISYSSTPLSDSLIFSHYLLLVLLELKRPFMDAFLTVVRRDSRSILLLF